jgi:hypothetical protein
MKDISDKLIGGAMICGSALIALVGINDLFNLTSHYNPSNLTILTDNINGFAEHILAITTTGLGLYGIRIGNRYLKK